MTANLIQLAHGTMMLMLVMSHHLLLFARRTLPTSLLLDHRRQVQLGDIMLVMDDSICGHFNVAGEVLGCLFR